jgi:hypothetical protein
VDGTNTLKLTLGLAGSPPQMPKDLTLVSMVHELAPDQLGGQNLPAPVASVEFPGSLPPSFPATLTASFDVKSPFGRWAWQDAQRIQETTPDEIFACASVLKKVHAALSQKDLPGLLPMLELKTAEMARAFYVAEEERRQDQEQFFQGVFNDSQFAMEPLKTDDLELVAMGENRVFLLQHQGGAPALESKELSEGYCFTLPVYLSKINGEWKIVR